MRFSFSFFFLGSLSWWCLMETLSWSAMVNHPRVRTRGTWRACPSICKSRALRFGGRKENFGVSVIRVTRLVGKNSFTLNLCPSTAQWTNTNFTAAVPRDHPALHLFFVLYEKNKENGSPSGLGEAFSSIRFHRSGTIRLLWKCIMGNT